MSSYGGQDLFGSGPHRFEVGGISQRHEKHGQPGADGEALTVMGKTGRSIEQHGTLLADSVASLQSQVEAVEAAMDGRGAELVDDLGRRWSEVVMLSFDTGAVRRVGPRLALDYTVRYWQVYP